MDESWIYIGMSTLGDEIAVATSRPRWNLSAPGRKARGEWQLDLLDLRRETRGEVFEWLWREIAEAQGPIGQSRRLSVLLDVSEYGAGDLLRKTLIRAFDRMPRLSRKVRPVMVDVTERDVLRTGRGDGVLVVARRELLTPLLDSVEGKRLTSGKGRFFRDLKEQVEGLRQRRAMPGAEERPEDLVRAVALCAWALDLEGGDRLKGFGASDPINVC